MIRRFTYGVAAIAFAVLLAAPVGAQLTPYSQDFEGLDQMDPAALANDGWLVFGIGFIGDTFIYPYGPFPAPNGGAGFSAVASGEGGPDQGDQQLSVYNDYNNGDHGNGFNIEANVFQEQVVGAGDVGKTYFFNFDAKRGNINDPAATEFPGACDPVCQTTALAFYKTLDPNAGFALTNFIVLDTTDLPDAWANYELSIAIDPGLVGQILQFGYLSNATKFEPSGVFYDNINFAAGPLTTLCHIPPGNAGDAHTITVGGNAPQAHLNHGDTLGACPAPAEGVGPSGTLHAPGSAVVRNSGLPGTNGAIGSGPGRVTLDGDGPASTGRLQTSRRADGGRMESLVSSVSATSNTDLPSASATANDGTPALDRHLANVKGASTAEVSQTESQDVLLVALGQGHELETRLEVVRGLVGRVDVSINPLLERHVQAIQAEAKALGRDDLARQAEQLMRALDY